MLSSNITKKPSSTHVTALEDRNGEISLNYAWTTNTKAVSQKTPEDLLSDPDHMKKFAEIWLQLHRFVHY